MAELKTNNLDFFEVIKIEGGHWLRAVDSLENIEPSCFSISPLNGKTNFNIPVTCFSFGNGEINYKKTIGDE